MATGTCRQRKNSSRNKPFSLVQCFCQDSLLKLHVHVHRIRSISAVCILKFCKFRQQDVFWSGELIHVLLLVILINSRQKLKRGLWTQYVNIAFLLHHHSCTHIYLCVTVLFHFSSLLAALVEMEGATTCEYQECFVVEDRAARAINHIKVILPWCHG